MNGMIRRGSWLLALVALGLPRAVAAQEEHPFQVALLAPIQAFPEEDAIRGVRLSLLYGKNVSMTGFDLGVVSHTTREFLGVQFGLVGMAEGSFTGLQSTAVNLVQGDFEGLQYGIVNSVETGRGVQIGPVNHARNFRGLQFGLVNYAETMNGVQVGLVNIIVHGGVLPVMPLVNWSLDEGSLPN
jgi:hypothetical protein